MHFIYIIYNYIQYIIAERMRIKNQKILIVFRDKIVGTLVNFNKTCYIIAINTHYNAQ